MQTQYCDTGREMQSLSSSLNAKRAFLHGPEAQRSRIRFKRKVEKENFKVNVYFKSHKAVWDNLGGAAGWDKAVGSCVPSDSR